MAKRDPQSYLPFFPAPHFPAPHLQLLWGNCMGHLDSCVHQSQLHASLPPYSAASKQEEILLETTGNNKLNMYLTWIAGL